MLTVLIDVKVQATHIDHAGIFRQPGFCDITANGETRIAELLFLFNIVAPGYWHVVHNPKHTVQRWKSQTVSKRSPPRRNDV